MLTCVDVLMTVVAVWRLCLNWVEIWWLRRPKNTIHIIFILLKSFSDPLCPMDGDFVFMFLHSFIQILLFLVTYPYVHQHTCTLVFVFHVFLLDNHVLISFIMWNLRPRAGWNVTSNHEKILLDYDLFLKKLGIFRPGCNYTMLWST